MRKKWKDWSSQIKGRKCKEIRERNITGGGSADETSSFSATEERLLAILGQTPLVGVPGLRQEVQIHLILTITEIEVI